MDTTVITTITSSLGLLDQMNDIFNSTSPSPFAFAGTDPVAYNDEVTTTLSSAAAAAAAAAAIRAPHGPVFSKVMAVMKLIQLLVGFCGNAMSLMVLLLFRHFLAHPFWFYLVTLCTVDLLGCLSFLIEMEDPLDHYHTFLFNGGHINMQLEIWILNMIRDLSAWLIVFIAVERWKSVCWNSWPTSLRSPRGQNHPPQPVGGGGLASFKRRTAQLETFFIVAGALMIINAANYFANENLYAPDAIDRRSSDIPVNATVNKTADSSSSSVANTVVESFVTPVVALASSSTNNSTRQLSSGASSTEHYLAQQWIKIWPFLREIKQCWLPALILLALNCSIVVHTVTFLWNSKRQPSTFGRRMNTFRRLTSSSTSTQAPQTTAMTTPGGTNGGSMSPLAVNANTLLAAATPTSIAYHTRQAQRRRRLVFAWLTLLALPTIFITLTLPLSIVNVSYDFEERVVQKTKEELNRLLIRDSLVHWLADCNHTINCFIYCLTIGKFRMAIVKLYQSLVGGCTNCIAVLRKKPINQEYDEEQGGGGEQHQQCQLMALLERARQKHRFHTAKKRKFVVGVAENVEAISSFHHHYAAAHMGIRRASGMESGIAFNLAHFHE